MRLCQSIICLTALTVVAGVSVRTSSAQVVINNSAQARGSQLFVNPKVGINFSALPTLNTADGNSAVVPASVAIPAAKSKVQDSVNGLAESFSSAYSVLETEPPKQVPAVPHLALAPRKINPEPQPSEIGSVDGEFSPSTDPIEPSHSEAAALDNAFAVTEQSDEGLDFAPVGLEDEQGSGPSWETNLDVEPVWWRQLVQQPIHAPNSPIGVDSNSLVYETLVRSPRIRALSQDPLIRELQIVEADSDFDPVAFIRSQFQDRVDPVGDSLSVTVDGSPFLDDHIWTGVAGVRKRTRTGASYDLSQTLGFQNSNSNFFTPQDQGTATLALNVTQPLLRGRGRYINQTQILIAQAATGGAWNTFVGELQDEIQATVDAYWRLYFDRSVYLQKRRNVERGDVILQTLEGRRDLDSLPSQIARARSAVQSRKTDLANALRDIRNSETELRRLTANRNWAANQSIEMIPTELPIVDAPPLGLENVVYTALEHRPEIKEVISRSKVAAVQRDISENELLPQLDLLLGTYVSALQGESQLFEAVQDQFGAVTPGYSVGVEWELPFRNRAARTRHAQRQVQIVKIRAEIDEVMQNVVAESQVSLRRVESAKETMQAAHQAIEAARVDLEQNFRRWESFALIEGDLADGRTPTTVLDQLLDSQERLTSAELVFSQAELELKSAEVALLRTMGTLLIHRNVNFNKSYNGDLPTVDVGQSANQFLNPQLIVGQPVQQAAGIAAPVTQ